MISSMKKMHQYVIAVAMSLLSAAACAGTIEVTTFDDEDGTNVQACSLREAVFAAAAKRAYGGCTKGQPFHNDTITLKAGEYKLNNVLKPTSNIHIQGDESLNYLARDAFNRFEPKREMLKTTIRAMGATRLFDTAQSRKPLTLSNVILQGGQANGTTLTTGVGGAIRAGGFLSLNRVQIHNAFANITGGAIYLEGSSSGMSANNSEFTMNRSAGATPSNNRNPLNLGAAVLGMSCVDNLKFTTRDITLANVSMTVNGASGSQSVIDICGAPTANIVSTTIAQNQYQGADGAAIRYSDYLPTLASSGGQPPTRVYADSKLDLQNITIVENAGIGLLYSDKGALSVSNSILAFNDQAGCHYQAATVAVAARTKTSFKSNLFAGTEPTDDAQAAVSDCPMPFASGSNNLYVGSDSMGTYLGGLVTFEHISLPGYVPVAGSDAVDYVTSTSACPVTDQRSVSRSAKFVDITTTINTSPSCDIGAIELSQLTSTSILEGINNSYALLTRNYQFLSDEQKAELTDRDKEIVAQREENIREFIAGVDASFKYRKAYVHVFDVDISPETANIGVVDLDADDAPVAVMTQSLGQGFSLKRTGVPADISSLEHVADVNCEWDTTLKAVAIWYTGALLGQETPAGEVARCQYTLTVNGQSADGLIELQIRNVAPMAFDKSFIMPYHSVSLDIPNILVSLEDPNDPLKNDSDDGDGTVDIVGIADFPKHAYDPAQPPKPAFFQRPIFNESGSYIGDEPLNIRIVEKPQLGRLEFEFSGACPDNDIRKSRDICYGGKLTYHNKNTFSPFNDSFGYQVIDADLQSSNVATITITNTATTTEDTRQHGGSMGVGGLFALLLLAAGAARIRRLY